MPQLSGTGTDVLLFLSLEPARLLYRVNQNKGIFVTSSAGRIGILHKRRSGRGEPNQTGRRKEGAVGFGVQETRIEHVISKDQLQIAALPDGWAMRRWRRRGSKSFDASRHAHLVVAMEVGRFQE